MSKKDILKKIKEIKPYLKKTYSVSEIGLFGSYAREEDTLLSDIDLLYKIDEKDNTVSLFDLVDMKIYLEKVLHKSVDIVDKNYLKPSLRDFILKEAILV